MRMPMAGLLTILLAFAPASHAGEEEEKIEVPTPESMGEAVSSGGRWNVYLDPHDAPWRVILEDAETTRLFQLVDFPAGTDLNVEWENEDRLHISEGGKSWRMLFAPPLEEGGIPGIQVTDFPGASEPSKRVVLSGSSTTAGMPDPYRRNVLKRTEIIMSQPGTARRAYHASKSSRSGD